MFRQKHTAEEMAAQAARNVEAWCGFHRAPEVQYLEHRWYPQRPDRVLIYGSLPWLDWLTAEMLADDGAVYQWNLVGKHHPLEAVGIYKDTAVEGWRGRRVFTSIQLIWHVHDDLVFIEIDFDWFSAATGALGLILHGAEVAWNYSPRLIGKPKRLTDSFRIARKLHKAGILKEAA